MALFKILRGESSRISTDITPFHDGYAYLTPDDGGFYIDALVGDTQKRIRINPSGGGSRAVTATLTVAGWENGQQTISVDGLTADQNGIIGLTQDISTAEKEAVRAAEMTVCGQSDGTLTIAMDGDKPTCDIPVVIILFG